MRPDSIDTRSAIDNELLKLLSKYGSRVPFPVVLVALMIAYLAAKSVDWLVCLIWLSIVITILAVRFYVLKRLPNWTHIPLKKRINIGLYLSLINGLSHSLALLFFPFLSDFERALLTLVIAALCTGAIATTGGHRGIFLAYMIPTMGALNLAWAVSAVYPHFNSIHLYIWVLIMFFTYVVYALSKDAYRQFSESISIRSQQTELNLKLEQALTEAEAANAAKTRFLAAASHDLRQPIHTLSLLSASLSMRPLDERSREISEHMATALDSLASQLDALLDISKLDACIIELNQSSFNLSHLCQRLVDEFSQGARNKGLDISATLPEQAMIYSDELLLERVLRNLLSNSVKYTSSGQIALQIKQVDKHWLVEISDTGIGIPEAEHKLIFEEFYQSHNKERDRSKGLGLGLSIVKRLIKLLDINLALTSESGQGTCITLTLAAADKAAKQGNLHSEIEIPWSDLCILVVDDEPMVRFGMESLLSQLGAKVLVAPGTLEAVKLARHDCPDILLADFRLRGKDDGLNTVNEIRKINPDIKAMLISGDTAPERLKEAHAANVPLLHKPLSLNALTKALGK